MQYANGILFDLNYARMYSPRMSIGDRLDKAMEAAEIQSQSELSRRSGVPQATISRILKGGGTKGPETETIRRLADACNVTFEWLNQGIGDDAEVLMAAASIPKQPSAVELAAELTDIIRGYAEGDATDRTIILTQARAILGRRRSRKSAGSD